MKKILSLALTILLISGHISSYAADIASEYSGRHRYENIYESNITFNEASLEETESVLEADAVENISDEELQIQVLSEASDITGWETCASMTSARSNMSSVVINNNIYTFGGTESGVATDKTEMFDTETELWTRKTSMPEGRYKHTSLYLNGKVYICAGYDTSNSAVSDIAIYDVETDTWETSVISTPNNNTNYASGIYNNELYIFGGNEDGAATQKAYKYNFTTNMWTQIVSMPINTIDAKAATTSYGFYILSDIDVLEYNHANNTITQIDTLPRSVMDYAFIVKDYVINSGYVQDDALVISGGRESVNSTSLSNVKVRAGADYEFTNEWLPEWYNDLRLIRGLSCHNMIEANGYVYVFGGQITSEQEQRIMFRRNSDERHDDYLDNQEYDLTNGYVYGSINHSHDYDYFKFTPSETGKYEIDTLNAIQSNNIGYVIYTDITGENLNISDVPHYIGGIPMEAGKEYKIAVSDTSLTWAGNYYFRVRKINDDVPDTIEEAAEIQMGTIISKIFHGRIDLDCMYFDVPITGIYSIETVTYSDEMGSTKAKVVIQDEDKNILHEYQRTNSGKFTESIKLNKGRYYITLSAPNDNYNYNEPDYTLKISNTAIYKQMNEARYRHGLVATSENIYAIGGFNEEYNLENSFEKYSPATSMWSVGVRNTAILRHGTSAIATGNKIYLVGGIKDNSTGAMNYTPVDDSIMVYDVDTAQWTGVGDLDIDRERVGLAVKDNEIYIVGGRSYLDTSYSSEIQMYNIETNTVIDYDITLPDGIIDPQIFFKDDVMYVVGGVDSEGYSDKVYALESGSWVQKESVPYKSTYLRGKEYNGNFFVAAVNSSGNVDILKYDTEANSWTILHNDFIEDCSYYGMEILNGMMYITGGYSVGADVVTNHMYSYDVVTDVTTMDISMPVRTIGYEYEQSVNAITNPPEILNVNAKVIDATRGIYELYINEDDYSCDKRTTPFFFWSAREGMFVASSDDYSRVIFYADKGTGDRQVKVVVGIGDGRGYVDKKSFLLNGNNETE